MQRNLRNQLKHTLSRHSSLGFFHVHHPVYPQLLRNPLVLGALGDRLRLVRAPQIISRDNLDEMAGVCMTDFDESAVEEEDIRMISDGPLHRAFPLDRVSATRVPVTVDIQPKHCGRALILGHPKHTTKHAPS